MKDSKNPTLLIGLMLVAVLVVSGCTSLEDAQQSHRIDYCNEYVNDLCTQNYTTHEAYQECFLEEGRKCLGI